MTFSKEDKAAWLDSEVMREFEKFGEAVLSGPPPESFQPLEKTAEAWEDEDLEEKITIAAEEFENSSSIKEEFVVAYNKNLLINIEKVAHRLSDKANIKATYRVERALKELKVLLREGKNAQS
jgi:hypothetical protein